ncbi:MAG: rod shape-determining protein MreD [Hydrogenophilales bacterium CG17_big_fil_post_rev_8_21_14_2_50_63_12]|nr:MAG: rod shape-determining protein MreD [Hydrogenophilales bacterium CG17_big_fil_post_rev_8_21_14_2_50_63_12]PIX97816.1 MAG: rod shape-determining protein MreD [Hydrogenophilales bacterium CG_4_10_14_3_um_filter_63_21]PJB04448.1 MAG: rod shape-determining protein MreD [Hydrogenophilales bacterium CG_4_9_14_3_um_filter_63_34]
MSLAKPLLPQGAALAAPATRAKVMSTLFAALCLTLLPWADGLRWLLPDLTLMVLLYWCIHAPRLAGLGIAFALGLLTDVTHGLLLGLDALAYCGAAFVALMVQKRLEGFDVPRQTLQLAPLLLGKEALVLTLGLAFGRGEADWRYLAAGLLAALLWLPLAMLLDRVAGRPVPESEHS